MKPEDFDKSLQENDPARDLSKMSETELQEIAVAAVAAEPVVVKKSAKWNKGAIAAAAAALLIVPTLNGAFTADAPPVLRVSMDGQNSAPAGAMGQQETSATMSSDQSLKMIYPGYWNFYKLQLADGVSVDFGTAPAYENKALANAAEVAQDIANYFKLGKLKFDSEYDSYTINPDGNEGPTMWAYTEGPWANYSYYNTELDPWRECYYSVDPAVEGSEGSSDSVSSDEYVPCEPTPAENLPSEKEAKQMALEFWNSFGIDTSDLNIDTWGDEWSVYVNASGPDDFYAASYSISFVANGEIQSSYGSLTYLAEIGEYDLVDAQAAIDRANAFTDQQIAYYEENDYFGGGVMPMLKDGATTEPALTDDAPTPDVTIDPIETGGEEYVQPEPAVLDFVVTKIELTWQMYYAENGQALYLPTYNFYGYTVNEDGSKGDEYTEWPISTTIAVVDEQIDIDSFYGYWLGFGRGMAID